MSKPESSDRYSLADEQVWKGLEDNIDAADPDPLSEAVARTEEWLTTYTRSKVFAVFNAEVSSPWTCRQADSDLTTYCQCRFILLPFRAHPCSSVLKHVKQLLGYTGTLVQRDCTLALARTFL